MSKHLDDKLIDYAWGMLTPQEQDSAEAHLRECADCRRELARHQSLADRLAATIPAMLPAAPASVRNGWTNVAARLPQLRPASAPRHHGLPGFVAVGLALSSAVMILVAVMAEAWLYRPTLSATALSATQSITPIASATSTLERPTPIATPVSWMIAPPVQAPHPSPAIATARP
jgi:anti-sigma factor RsiW